jgi:hypothetical protein
MRRRILSSRKGRFGYVGWLGGPVFPVAIHLLKVLTASGRKLMMDQSGRISYDAH